MAKAPPRAPINPLLQQRIKEYIDPMEKHGVDYSQLGAAQLLAIDAINEWSGRALEEGGDVKFSVGGANSCCATYEELNSFIALLAGSPALLYPVSSFSLPEDPSTTEGMLYNRYSATYRLRPHSSGSRMDAAGIARSRPVGDAEAAFKIWLTAATETCISYLGAHTDRHGLVMAEEDITATRQMFTNALRSEFSIGQVWNVTWRAAQNAAALSTREFYNRTKAAKTIPNKIKKLIAQAKSGELDLEHYDRTSDSAVGAVLTLFEGRFGVTDKAPGPEVLGLLQDLAANTPEPEKPEDAPNFSGTLFFAGVPESLDLLVMECMAGHQITDVVHLNPDRSQTEIRLTTSDCYAFDGEKFVKGIFNLKGEPFGEPDANQAALLSWGVSTPDANDLAYDADYPFDLEQVHQITTSLSRSLPSNLAGIRLNGENDSADVLIFNGGAIEASSSCLDLGYGRGPTGYGSGDRNAVFAAHAGKNEELLDVMFRGLKKVMRFHDPATRPAMLRSLAERMLLEAEEQELNQVETVADRQAPGLPEGRTC